MESSCSWKEKGGPVHTFSASDIPKGTILTAFYSTFTTNSGQQKAKENLIFAISYVEFNGKKIADDKRVVISCSKQTFTKFMFY